MFDLKRVAQGCLKGQDVTNFLKLYMLTKGIALLHSAQPATAPAAATPPQSAGAIDPLKR